MMRQSNETVHKSLSSHTRRELAKNLLKTLARANPQRARFMAPTAPSLSNRVHKSKMPLLPAPARLSDGGDNQFGLDTPMNSVLMGCQ